MAEQSTGYSSLSRYRLYAGNSSISTHAHAGPSLTVVLGGCYQEAIGKRTADHHCGSALICPEGVAHAQRFGAHGARKLIIEPGNGLLDYLVTTMPVRSAPATRSRVIAGLAARIDAERRTDDLFSNAAIEGLVWQVAAEMGRSLAGGSVPASAIVRRACAMIDASDGEALSMAALCRHVDCHPATLTRAFRREHGCTPGDYQRRVRIGKAACLLRTTSLSVAEVAATCGFCDQAHLARSFRAVHGCSPSNYRRRA